MLYASRKVGIEIARRTTTFGVGAKRGLMYRIFRAPPRVAPGSRFTGRYKQGTVGRRAGFAYARRRAHAIDGSAQRAGLLIKSALPLKVNHIVARGRRAYRARFSVQAI
jgi:hypothetical protein